MDVFEYKTISTPTDGEYKEKGSKFIAYAFPVSTRLQIKENIEMLRKTHLKSRHVCYAYRMGADGSDFRQSDDGEPSGTAGRPILGQIDSFELTNVLVAVVRYFGGTKLGVSGLIHAYRSASQAALENAEILEKSVEAQVLIVFEYEHTGPVMRSIDAFELQPEEIIYLETTQLKVWVPRKNLGEFIQTVKAAVSSRSLDDISAETEIEGLMLEVVN